MGKSSSRTQKTARIEAGGIVVTLTVGVNAAVADQLSQSPRAKAKRSLRAMAKSRGRNNSNLWVVYSPKTDSDWILPSDYELVHWLACLEADPSVRTFDLAPQIVLSYDLTELRATELDATVTMNSGPGEWREIKGLETFSEAEVSQRVAQNAAAASEGMKYVRLTHADLAPKARLATRWMKAVAFAAALRDRDHGPCYGAVAATVTQLVEGTVGMIIERNPSFRVDEVVGELVRLAADCKIAIDLSKRPLGLLTPWKTHAW